MNLETSSLKIHKFSENMNNSNFLMFLDPEFGQQPILQTGDKEQQEYRQSSTFVRILSQKDIQMGKLEICF